MWRISVGVLLLAISFVEGKNSYVVTCSDRLVPGRPIGVRVSILTSSSDVTVNAEIQHAGNNSVVVTNQTTISKGVTALLQLAAPDRLLKSSYKLVVRGSGGLAFHNQSALIFDDNWPLIYIQTDKTRYSAGQEVKYRAVFLQPTLLGYSGNVSLAITDGKGAKVLIVGPVQPQEGVVSGVLKLSSSPAFGDWHIEASAREKSAKKKIVVRDYALPKFSVTIALPPVIMESDVVIPLNVTARFTSNVDVFGNCTIQIYSTYDLRSYLTYSKQINGSVHFDVPMSAVRPLGLHVGILKVRALVTDNATALTMVSEEELSVHDDSPTYYAPDDLLITRVDNRRSTFVPGINFYTTIFVARGWKYDLRLLGTKGTIEVGPIIHTAEVKQCNLNSPATQWLDVQTTHLKHFNTTFDESGYAPLLFHVPNYTERVELQLWYGSEKLPSIKLQAVPRNSPDLFRISTDTATGRVGETLILSIEATTALTGMLLIEVISRGVTINTKRVVLHSDQQKSVPIAMTAEMVPQAFILASHVTQQGDLISDYVVIHVHGSPFRNNVNVTFSEAVYQPGQPVSLTINADPNSRVYVLSEDMKNRLIVTENDIYFYEVNTDVLSRKISAHNNRNEFYWSGVIQESGTVCMSDASVFDITSVGDDLLSDEYTLPRKCVAGPTYPPMRVYTFTPGMIPTPPGGDRTYAPSFFPSPGTGPALELGTIVRSKFPETWIWDDYLVGPSGTLVINTTVPDSMTSWVTSVFATNSQTGFGISQLKPSITVKKDFFVTMNAPSSIVLGEEFLLQLTVFNYMDTLLKVSIQVTTSDKPNSPADITVKPGSGHSTFLHLTPQHLGTLKIHVIAKAGFNSAVDEIGKEVVVKPAGVHKETNEQHLVSVSSSDGGFTKLFNITDPPNMVNGTKSVRLRYTGNYMVPSIDGLQSLINMPSGCGEQVLVHFAPDIYVTKYLKTVGKLTPDIEKRSNTYLMSGLQQELKYQHKDGSFSAWGDSDRSGSTWLTAFVIKCFRQADGLLQIDDSIMRKAIAWLIQFQKPDGSFTEPGNVIHYQMQAGTSSGLKMTAFILNAILENQDLPGLNNVKVSQVLQKGQSYLQSNLHSITDVYTLAIVCYSLAKAGSHQRSTCFTKLEATKTLDGDKTYWEANTHVTRRRSVVARSTSTTRAPARDVEATAYCLLTYIELGETGKGMGIVKWLVSQRNPYGGFVSTQDTVISLQALSEFSSRASTSDPNYNVAFNVYGGSFHDFYVVTPANEDVVHESEVQESLDNVVIVAVGSGLAVVDVTMSYYVTAVTSSNSVISVTSSLPHESLNSVTVKPCIRWHGAAQSGMLVAEVEMPTGFVSDVDALKSQTSIKKHETNGRVVALYFDGIGAGQQVCVDVKMDRSDPVVRSQACHITVYDYYEPTNQATTRYESGILKSSNICDVCPLCNFCTGSSGVGVIGVGK